MKIEGDKNTVTNIDNSQNNSIHNTITNIDNSTTTNFWTVKKKKRITIVAIFIALMTALGWYLNVDELVQKLFNTDLSKSNTSTFESSVKPEKRKSNAKYQVSNQLEIDFQKIKKIKSKQERDRELEKIVERAIGEDKIELAIEAIKEHSRNGRNYLYKLITDNQSKKKIK